jgi:hypothetical protein
MKKKAPARKSRGSKKPVADLAPRNTAGLKGGVKSNISKKADDTEGQVISKIG